MTHERSSQSPWQLCPVCQGCGTVPPDFYARLGSATSTARERCKRCSGVGTIVAPSWPTQMDMETAEQREAALAKAGEELVEAVRPLISLAAQMPGYDRAERAIAGWDELMSDRFVEACNG